MDAGTGDITTSGNVKGGTLEATGNATIGGALKATGKVTGDGVDAGTGAITGGSLTVTGKVTGNGVDAGTGDITTSGNVKGGTLETTGDATIGGDLKVTGTITTDRMVFGDPATNNYTEIDHGKVTSKNLVVNGAGQTISSSSTFDVEKNEVGFTNTATGDHSYYKQTAKGINGYVTDKDGNKTYTKVTATENSFQVQDKDGKNKNHQVNTKDSSVTEITNEEGKTTKTEQTAKDITNTAKDGTITNDGKNIVNVASENISNKSQTMDTTVTGKATESYGELDTTVNGKETHKVTGDQENTIGGSQTTTVTGDISNKAKNITNEAETKLTDKVGDNTRVLDSEGITDTVPGAGGKGSTFKQRIDAIMGNVKTDAGESEVTQKGDEITSVVGKGEATNSRVTQKKGSLEAGVTDGTNTNASYDVADASAKVLTGGTKVNKLQDNLDSSVKTITNGTYTTSKVQTALNITNTAKDGTITNDAKNIVNNATDKITDQVGSNTRVIDQTSITDTVGTASRKIEDGKITDIAGDSTITTENGKGTTFTKTGSTAYGEGGPTDTNISGNLIQTGRIESNELKVSDKDGDNTADLNVKAGEGVTASASDGNTTGSLDVKANEVGSSVKDAARNGSDFRQRIDAIMGNVKTADGESEVTQKGNEITSVVGKGETTNSRVTQKKGSLEAGVTDGTNTNASYDVADASAKVLTGGTKVNKLQDNLDSSVKTITNGTYTTSKVQTALNITNTAKDGTITNDAKNIVNNATDKITDQVGSNTRVIDQTSITDTVGTASRKIEDGKITDIAGDSTITTENGKGTTFTKTGSTAYREGGPTDTNISGNTITTGKVTMDYADVMKDLGVRGNANITGTTTTKTLNVTENATVGGTTTTKTLNVTENATVGGTLDVTGKATFSDDVDIKENLSVGKAVTAKSYKVGDKTYIDANGINANDQKITNVADGSISEGSKDAVNGGQLYGVKRDLEHQVDKVGANAAAMANLRPMEFDPSSKWNIAAAIGNYGSETAAALGAFYRPNDDVMVNLSTAFGTGENMVGGGVSVRLGKGGNKLSREENNALKDQVNDLTARMDALLSVLNPNMSKDFPDVPENHWAYEAVSRLAGNDIVQGYPDGEFHGERTMTRYEMAEIIYNALSRGAEAEKELVEEFKPELQAMAASEKATAEKAEG